MVRARWIVGADGSDSRVRRWAGSTHSRKPRLRYAFRRHFRVAPWTDHMELHWGIAARVTRPLSAAIRCAWRWLRTIRTLRLEEGLRQLPELRARLNGAETVSTERGALTGNRKLRRVWRGNVALIGDASGTVDAITGEGLWARLQPGDGVGELSRDGRSERATSRNIGACCCVRVCMARLMLTLDGRPRLQQRTLRPSRNTRSSSGGLLELHVGVLSPLHLALDGLTLGWGLLTA